MLMTIEGSSIGQNGSFDGVAERLVIDSGLLVIIDQFMLANQQFLGEVASATDPIEASELNNCARKFGGMVLTVAPGTYRVLRDPLRLLMIVARSGEEVGEQSNSPSPLDTQFLVMDEDKAAAEQLATIFVDTRCLVFADAAILKNSNLLARFRSLREQKNDKDARDLLRENGAAVRYGFNRNGDTLGVFSLPDSQLVALWPQQG